MLSLVPVIYLGGTIGTVEYFDWHIKVSDIATENQNKEEALKLEHEARVSLLQSTTLLAAAAFLSALFTVGQKLPSTSRNITLANLTYAGAIYIAYFLRMLHDRALEIRFHLSRIREDGKME